MRRLLRVVFSSMVYLALGLPAPSSATNCPAAGFVNNEFFVSASVTSVTADSAETVSKLGALGVGPGTFEFGYFTWDCDAVDLEPGNPDLGRYAGELSVDEQWLVDVIFQNPPSGLVMLEAFFGFHEVLVANDLPAGSGGIFDPGGDGYAFLGTPRADDGGGALPLWLEWTEAELLLIDPSGQALSDTALPIGPPDLSLFPVQSFVLRGFDSDEAGAFTIAAQIDALRVPEPSIATLVLVSGLIGLLRANRVNS